MRMLQLDYDDIGTVNQAVEMHAELLGPPPLRL